MELKSDRRNDTSTLETEERDDQKIRRPYEKPRIEAYEISRSIVGNETPVTADGLSGTYRV